MTPKQNTYHWIPQRLVNTRKLITYLKKFCITSTNVFTAKYIARPIYESLKLKITALRKKLSYKQENGTNQYRKVHRTRIPCYIGYSRFYFCFVRAFKVFSIENSEIYLKRKVSVFRYLFGLGLSISS